MKNKEKKEIQQKDQKELVGQISKIKEELVKLRMEKQAGRLKNIQLIKRKRYHLALVKTILKEKEQK